MIKIVLYVFNYNYIYIEKFVKPPCKILGTEQWYFHTIAESGTVRTF